MSDIGVLVSTEEEAGTRLVLDYTSRDYAAIRSQLVGLAKGFMPEWETVGEAADFGTLLLELFAYMGDVMHFYIDRTASEAFLGTAIRRQSVLYIADQFGYVPIGQQAATVRLVFKLAEGGLSEDDEPIVLPVGTRLHNNPESADTLIVFELETPITLTYEDSVSGIEISGYASEDITVNESPLGMGRGAPNTDLIIPDKGVIFGSIEVRTVEAGRNVVWSYTSDLSLARPTQSSFTTFTDDLELTHIVFGDNASGRIVPVNSQIFVTYRYGVGVEANDLDPNTITTVVPPAGIDVWGVTVTNPESPLGGTDPESVESMRYSVPRAAARIKSRAVTLNDYADLAMQVPSVAKSVSHGAVYTAVYVRVAPQGGAGNDFQMNTLCNAVEAYLSDKIMVGSTVYCEPRSYFDLWRNIYIQMIVHVSEGYNRTQVRLAVDAAVRAALAFDQVDFGYQVTIGRIYRNALAIQGVEWVELTHLSDEPPPDEAGEETGAILETVVSDVWTYSTSTDTSVDPEAGKIRANSGVTSIALSTSTRAGRIITDLANVRVGDHFLVRERNAAERWWSGVVTAAPVDHLSWYEFTVVHLDSSATGTPTNNSQVLVSVGRYEIQAAGMVHDLTVSTTDGTHLLIPRITPLPPIKQAAITNVALTSNVATITTAAAHGMVVDNTINVTGVVPSAFNGQYTITAVPTTTTLTYDKTNADVASVASSGLVTTVNLPESEEDWPDLTEAERTHDGLWVRAVGGMVNT